MKLKLVTLLALLEKAWSRGYARGILGHAESAEQDAEKDILDIIKEQAYGVDRT